MNIEKELKSIKDFLEDIHKGSANENKTEHKTQFQNNQRSSTETTPQPASCQCAHKHNPNHGNKSNIQYMMEIRACSHEPGTVNYPGVMIAPGQALPRVQMMICCPRGNVAPGQLHCPGASSSSSDHYEFI